MLLSLQKQLSLEKQIANAKTANVLRKITAVAIQTKAVNAQVMKKAKAVPAANINPKTKRINSGKTSRPSAAFQ